MKLVYSFPHTLGSTGIGTVAAEQVRGLSEHGIDITVYCTSLGCSLPAGVRVIQTMVFLGAHVRHRALGVERTYRYHDWRVMQAMRRMKVPADLVHCWPAGCHRTLTAARTLGVTSLREVPSAHTAEAFESAGRAAAAVGLKLPARHSHRFDAKRLAREEEEFRLADYLLVPSPFAERSFLERGFPPAQLALHQYGYDPQKFCPAPGENSTRERPFTALFVGRGEPNKGLHHALHAWIGSGAAEEGRFIICGVILPDYARLLARELSHPSVVQMGQSSTVGDVMRRADVLLLPTVTEGSALVTYEGQGCGCVLLVSDAAGAHVTHLQEALVHPVGDVTALTDHIRMVYENPALLARLREATLVNSRRLTWEKAAAAPPAIYRAKAS